MEVCGWTFLVRDQKRARKAGRVLASSRAELRPPWHSEASSRLSALRSAFRVSYSNGPVR